ncbi:SusE domain-containing protein [Flavobacterium daemonense]|uniref:SusE domain-containing protein n=1 Tax=Flavobacterium daemonense TaxID=1393049 RepID=UPI0011867260|nr:SusE domain-containing protein [Flavobacterium daemonense]KAF2334446.1 DUF5116 domain-containing protein [Flavobacterium daemonense]
MKNITKSLIALLALVAISCSVEDVQDRPVITGIDSPVLTAPSSGSAYTLTPDAADNQAERFTWKSANYGGDVEVNYTVQMDVKGNNFKTPQELGSTKSENQTSVSVSKMNGAALALGAVPFTATDYEVRVKSDTNGSNVMYSSAVGITVSAYTTESPKLWLPGGYQNASGYGGDWTPTTAPQVIAEGYGKTAFEGYVYFAAPGEFLFTPAANWDHKFGMGADAGTLTVDGGANIPVASAGYYWVKADTKTLKYSLTSTKWGVIGSATAAITGGDGWGADIDMTYDSTAKKWSLKVALAAGEIKFRANDGWDINYGDAGADNVLEFNDPTNIKVPSAGNYTISLDLSTPRHYTYTLTKN